MRLVPPLKGDIVFLKVMVLNAEPQRTRSNAETIDLFPLRFSPPDRMAGWCGLRVSAMKNTS